MTNVLLPAVHRVPSEFLTIQAALDALEEGDTVLVDVGVYAEALTAPPLSFVLSGNTVPDTGSYPRPVIDPTSLPGSDTLKCLDLPGGDSVVVNDFRFHNGAAMAHPGYTVGGIRNGAGKFVAARCVWDSVYMAIHSVGLPVSLQRCVFTECFQILVYTVSAAIIATDVVFQGHSEWSLVQCGSNSTFTRCSMSNSPGDAHLAIIVGTNVSFTDCVIGPSFTPWNYPLQCSLSNSRFENNVFAGNQVSLAVITINAPCDSPVTFRNNVFLNNQTNPDSPAPGPFMVSGMSLDTTSHCGILIAEDNIFASSDCNAIFSSGTDAIVDNRFRNLTRGGASVRPSFRSLWLRRSTFDNTGVAAEAEFPGSINAEWNWWGDSTGPYNSGENPGGQGDTILGNVDFTPWYPDTSFLSVPGLGKPLPEKFTLEAYPNPFNSTLHLTLTPAQVGIVKLELFDILGRKVSEIWRGPLAFQKELAFNANELSSGIYFARVTDVIDRKTLATRKLVLLK